MRLYPASSPPAGHRVRRDKVDKTGVVTPAAPGKAAPHRCGPSLRLLRVILLVAGTDIRILGIDGSPLRNLTLDTTKDYQPQP